ICAVAGGADGWEAIEEFGKDKLEWLRKYIPLADGVRRSRTFNEATEAEFTIKTPKSLKSGASD
ncbi:MAG: transposase family protein, partial [Methylococcaceae bacterium]|nr:transposase family protein [Methylococcaceae bacterium]